MRRPRTSPSMIPTRMVKALHAHLHSFAMLHRKDAVQLLVTQLFTQDPHTKRWTPKHTEQVSAKSMADIVALAIVGAGEDET